MSQRVLTTILPLEELREIISECVKESVQEQLAHILETDKVEKQILTRKEAAEILSISLPTLHEYTRRGIITSYRLSSKVRYKRSDIELALIAISHQTLGD